MGMNEPESPQTSPRSGIVFFEIRQEKRPGVSDDHIGNSAAAVDEYADLSSDFARQLGEVSGHVV